MCLLALCAFVDFPKFCYSWDSPRFSVWAWQTVLIRNLYRNSVVLVVIDAISIWIFLQDLIRAAIAKGTMFFLGRFPIQQFWRRTKNNELLWLMRKMKLFMVVSPQFFALCFWPVLALYKSVWPFLYPLGLPFRLQWAGLLTTIEAEMQIQWVIIQNFPEY